MTKPTPNHSAARAYKNLRVDKTCLKCGCSMHVHPRTIRCKPCAKIVKAEQQRTSERRLKNCDVKRKEKAYVKQAAPPVKVPIYNVLTVAEPHGEQFGRIIDRILKGEAGLTL